MTLFMCVKNLRIRDFISEMTCEARAHLFKCGKCLKRLIDCRAGAMKYVQACLSARKAVSTTVKVL